MFEGFTLTTIDTGETAIRVCHGGSGPPLLLLHGHPQTHAMWHLVAPRLAQDFTVVAPDLRGYGDSAKPPTTSDHAPYAKRTMARDQVAVAALDVVGGGSDHVHRTRLRKIAQPIQITAHSNRGHLDQRAAPGRQVGAQVGQHGWVIVEHDVVGQRARPDAHFAERVHTDPRIRRKAWLRRVVNAVVDGQVLMRQDETQRIAVQRSENAGNG